MTPLAKKLAELSISNKRGWLQYAKILAPFPNEVKCFEVTQIYELASELGRQARERQTILESTAFLPAPVTWLEHQSSKDGMALISAYMLVQRDKTTCSCISVVGYEQNGSGGIVPVPLANLPLLGDSDADGWAINSAIKHIDSGNSLGSDDKTLNAEIVRSYWLYSVLSIINTPKIIHRNEHRVSSGFSKRLSRGHSHVKPFQLLPWHEIMLDVTPPENTPGSDGQRLSGPKALHFCRQHIRIRFGRLELVRAHWRGDAAIGIVQSKYKLTGK